jgi:hypothetical protein
LLRAVLEQHPVFLSLLRLPEEQVKIVMVVAVVAQAHLMEPAARVEAVVVVVGLGLMVLAVVAAAVRIIRAEPLEDLMQVVVAVGHKGRAVGVIALMVLPVVGLMAAVYSFLLEVPLMALCLRQTIQTVKVLRILG